MFVYEVKRRQEGKKTIARGDRHTQPGTSRGVQVTASNNKWGKILWIISLTGRSNFDD